MLCLCVVLFFNTSALTSSTSMQQHLLTSTLTSSTSVQQLCSHSTLFSISGSPATYACLIFFVAHRHPIPSFLSVEPLLRSGLTNVSATTCPNEGVPGSRSPNESSAAEDAAKYWCFLLVLLLLLLLLLLHLCELGKHPCELRVHLLLPLQFRQLAQLRW